MSGSMEIQVETKSVEKQNAGYVAECIASAGITGLYAVGASHYVKPVFLLFLLVLSASVFLFVRKRRIASFPFLFFTFTAFSTGFGTMNAMWQEKYVFLPGMVLAIVYGIMTILYRRGILKRPAFFAAGILTAVMAGGYEIARYRIPDGISAYFANHGVSARSVFTWLTISNQASLGFLVPAAGVALILLFAFGVVGKTEKGEQSGEFISCDISALCLTGAAILAFATGFFGFFGYEDMASPLLLVSLSIVISLSELQSKEQFPGWGRLPWLFIYVYPLFMVIREFLEGKFL